MATNIRPALQIYDTTLRDGVQQEGLALTVADKLAAARLLDQFGVDFIEGGWPGAVPLDTDFFRRAADELTLRHAQLAAFGSTRRPDSDAGRDPQVRALLDAQTPVVTLVAKSHDRHVEIALRTTLAENLRMIRDTVRQLLEQGRRVFVDAEHYFDGFRANRAYALAVAEAALDAGAEKVVLCDTNGGTLPAELAEIVAATTARGLAVGIHCHDDAGCAVANSLLAVSAGAGQVQGTANGYGERCGNANLFSVVGNLAVKEGRALLSPAQLAGMSRTAQEIGELADAPVPSCAPYVGASAFAHKGGLHASAVRMDPSLYQHIDPERVGNRSRILVSDLGGRSSVELKARELGYHVHAADERVNRAVLRIKELGRMGYAVESADASFELLLREQLAEEPIPRAFQVDSWMLSTAGSWDRPSALTRAVLRVTRAGRTVTTTGLSERPARALHRALCAALMPVVPGIDELLLLDEESRPITTDADERPATRVLLRFMLGGRSWRTVGVDRDPAAAMLLALRDAADYVLACGPEGAPAAFEERIAATQKAA
ncbi:MAG TPA: citramalate synthase [Actinocrinis sp.]|jgi:2-isopropylmalate synthase|uniref:citramalate synthase n=1 Tax=Actinocrinis sp. TaxID=1920516 RepID=UPI002D268D06|nr:citramalate synthase [Actinocrinis sp.]HZU56474.1 citramalate synthase [Actinocrinis sp.]